MSETSAASGNGEHKAHVSRLELTYDHDTHQVAIGGDPLPISLGQMILGEAMRVLDQMRRIAAAQAMQAAAVDAARTNEILSRTRGGRV